MERTAAQAPPMTVAPDPEYGRRRRRVLAALFGFALGVVLALALSPRSHWLVWMQLSGHPTLPDRLPLLERAAEAMSRDPGAQVAWGAWNLGTNPDASQVPYATVRPLVERFPSDPVALAAALRFMVNGKETPRLLEIAARGANADPENAFFPAMKAAVLFRAGQPGAGAVALADAARRPRWDDYVAGQVRGGWRLSDVVFGEGNTVARMAFMQDSDLSFYKALGEAAGTAAKYAGHLEKGGKLEAGYRVRHDLMTLGERMRREATTMTGSVAGVRITGAAANHLYGATAPVTDFALPSSPEARVWMDAYLRAAGHPHDMALVHTLSERASATRSFVFSDLFDWSGELMRFHIWLASASFLLLLTAWLGLFGLLSGGWRPPAPDATWYQKARALQLPAACALLIIYGLVTLQTLRVSAQINHGLERMVQHEGRFYAALSGQPWPE